MNTAKKTAICGAFCALLLATQYVFNAIKGVELVTLLFVTFCFTFGGVCGVLVAVAFCLLRCLIYGFFPLVSDPCLAGCSEPPAGGGLPCQDSGDRRPGRENENGADSKGLAPCRDRAAEADACTEVIRMAERRPGGSFEGKQHLL